jgi:hypothetical protein
MGLTSDEVQKLTSDPPTDSTVMNGEPYRVSQPGIRPIPTRWNKPLNGMTPGTGNAPSGGPNTSSGTVAGNSPGFNAAGPVGAVPVKPNPNRVPAPKPGSF